MVNVKFNIGCTRTAYFTKNQTAKVKAGIAIFEKVINHPSFKERICNFNWTSPEGTTFNRFLFCNGMSNTQVWDCIQDGCDWGTTPGTTTSFVNVVPCCSVSEMGWVANSPVPTICINTNVINNSWYTPVHIACCLVHEYCVNLGFSCLVNGTPVENWECTVPAACASICCDVARQMSMTDTDLAGYFQWINETNFNYYPCSTCFYVDAYTNTTAAPNTRIDELINTMYTELECLQSVTNCTPQETNRLNTVTECLNNLKEIKNRLYVTSLDGCEQVTSTVVESEVPLN